MAPAALQHGAAAIALGQRHQAGAGGLQLRDVGIHARRRGRAEGAGRMAGRRLGGPGIVDRMVAQIVRQGLAGGQALGPFGVDEVAGDDHRAAQQHRRTHLEPAERRPDCRHRLGQIERDRARRRDGLLRQEARRIVLEALQEHAVAGDPRLDLPVGRAGHAKADRQGAVVARQADHPDIVAEILAAELGADAGLAGQRQDLGFERVVAKGTGRSIAGRRQAVEVAAAGELHGLQAVLGREAADHQGQMVGWTGGGAERAQLLVDEGQQPLRRQ